MNFICRRQNPNPATALLFYGDNMKRNGIIGIVAVSLFAFASMPICICGQPGVTDTTFNRRFIPSIKPMMTYDQIVKLVGSPGVKVGEDRNSSPPTVQYRWQGGRGSVLTVRLNNHKVVDATVLAPNKHTYLIRGNGEVSDKTK